MTTDTRIIMPSFDVAVATLLEVVAESPEATHRHAYLDNMHVPFDLTATWLARLDAPIVTAAQGTYEFNGTKRYNTAILTTLWNRLFIAYDNTGVLAYDWPHIGFHGQHVDVGVAENFMVYVLLNAVQRANDGGLDWKGSAMRGLKYARRFLHNKTSGARVQASRADSFGNAVGAGDAHEKLWQDIDMTIAKAIASLTNKKVPTNG